MLSNIFLVFTVFFKNDAFLESKKSKKKKKIHIKSISKYSISSKITVVLLRRTTSPQGRIIESVSLERL